MGSISAVALQHLFSGFSSLTSSVTVAPLGSTVDEGGLLKYHHTWVSHGSWPLTASWYLKSLQEATRYILRDTFPNLTLLRLLTMPQGLADFKISTRVPLLRLYTWPGQIQHLPGALTTYILRDRSWWKPMQTVFVDTQVPLYRQAYPWWEKYLKRLTVHKTCILWDILYLKCKAS